MLAFASLLFLLSFEIFASDPPLGFTEPYYGTPKAGVDFGKRNLEFGVLGVQPKSPLIKPSPYLSLRLFNWRAKDQSSFHGRLTGLAGAILMGARPFGTSAQSGPAEDLLRTTKSDLIERGADPAVVNAFESFYYSDKYDFKTVLFGSLRAEIARAWKFAGPFSAALASTALLDSFSGRGGDIPILPYPRLQTDESVALRFKPQRSPVAAAIVAGISQNIAPYANDIAQKSLMGRIATSQIPPPEMAASWAPHAGMSVWGRLPLAVANTFQAHYIFENNPSTSKHKVSSMFSQGIFDARLGWTREAGDEILFQSLTAGADLRATPALSFGAEANFENGRFGQAAYDNRSLIFGVRGIWEKPSKTFYAQGGWRAFARDSYFDQKRPDYTAVRAEFNELIKKLKNTPGEQGAFYRIFLEFDPETRAQLIDGLCATPAGQEQYAQLCEWLGRYVAVVNGSLAALEEETYNRDIINLLGRYYFQRMAAKSTLSAVDLLVAAAMDNNQLSTIYPFRAADKELFKKWALFEIGVSGLGLPRIAGQAPSLQQVVDRLIEYLPYETADQLKRDYGADIYQLADKILDYVFELVRRDLNRIVLEWKRSTQELQGLQANKGLGASEVNTGAALQAFEKLESR